MSNPLKNESGIALFLVLWVMVLLTVIAGEFSYSMKTEINLVRNLKENTQAYYVALAGVHHAIYELVLKRAYLEERLSGTFRLNAPTPPVPFADGGYLIRIDNESGKVNVNEAAPHVIEMVIAGLDAPEKEERIMVDSLLDWRDVDDFHHVNGVESDYYASLPEPYTCRNGRLISIEELVYVRGFQRELVHDYLKELFSVAPNENLYRKKRSEIQVYNTLESREGADDHPIQQISTLEKREESLYIGKKTAYDKIDINSASLRMLTSLPGMTSELAHEILTFRLEKDFDSVYELKPIVGNSVFKTIEPYLKVEEGVFYTIRSLGTAGDDKTIQGIKVMVRVDKSMVNGFKVVEWLDDYYDPGMVESQTETQGG